MSSSWTVRCAAALSRQAIQGAAWMQLPVCILTCLHILWRILKWVKTKTTRMSLVIAQMSSYTSAVGSCTYSVELPERVFSECHPSTTAKQGRDSCLRQINMLTVFFIAQSASFLSFYSCNMLPAGRHCKHCKRHRKHTPRVEPDPKWFQTNRSGALRHLQTAILEWDQTQTTPIICREWGQERNTQITPLTSGWQVIGSQRRTLTEPSVLELRVASGGSHTRLHSWTVCAGSAVQNWQGW